MAWLDIALIIMIFLFAFILIWSRYENQRIIDTLNEIKEFFASLKGGTPNA